MTGARNCCIAELILAPTLDLASGFGAPSEGAWLKLVEKTLKGAGPETLISRTRDGIEIAPLYREGPAAPVRKAPPVDATRPWDIRATIRHPDPAKANAQILEDLEGGAASVLVKLDPKGRSGVAVGSKDDLARVLNGVLLDIAPVALNAGLLGPDAADWLGELAKGGPEAELYFHLDPLTAFAQGGGSPGPVESHIIHAATVAVRLQRTYPKAGLFMASGRIAHEAGGTEAQELAHAIACGLAYARALIKAGASADQAFGGVVLGLSGPADYFATIAKLRAARVLWAKVAAASGADAGKAARIEVRSSHRMLAALDPWTNMLRLASAAFGAGVGGADAIVLGSFTDALEGLPTAFARRQARNTQLVLMEEAHIARVADPAGGAWFLESLTDGMARAAWARFQAIEAAGGMVAALESALVQREIAEAAAAEEEAVRSGARQILGVTKFRNADMGQIEVEQVDGSKFAVSAPDPRKPGPDSACTPLKPHRLAEKFEGAQ